MKRRRHTPDQIVRKLREAERLLAEGKDITEVTKHLEVSEQTYHRWRTQFGSFSIEDPRRERDATVGPKNAVALFRQRSPRTNLAIGRPGPG